MGSSRLGAAGPVGVSRLAVCFDRAEIVSRHGVLRYVVVGVGIRRRAGRLQYFGFLRRLLGLGVGTAVVWTLHGLLSHCVDLPEAAKSAGECSGIGQSCPNVGPDMVSTDDKRGKAVAAGLIPLGVCAGAVEFRRPSRDDTPKPRRQDCGGD